MFQINIETSIYLKHFAMFDKNIVHYIFEKHFAMFQINRNRNVSWFFAIFELFSLRGVQSKIEGSFAFGVGFVWSRVVFLGQGAVESKKMFKVRVRVGRTRVSKSDGVSEVRTLLASESEVVTISLYESVSKIENSLSESVSEVMSEYVRGKVTYFVRDGRMWTEILGEPSTSRRRTINQGCF